MRLLIISSFCLVICAVRINNANCNSVPKPPQHTQLQPPADLESRNGAGDGSRHSPVHSSEPQPWHSPYQSDHPPGQRSRPPPRGIHMALPWHPRAHKLNEDESRTSPRPHSSTGKQKPPGPSSRKPREKDEEWEKFMHCFLPKYFDCRHGFAGKGDKMTCGKGAENQCQRHKPKKPKRPMPFKY